MCSTAHNSPRCVQMLRHNFTGSEAAGLCVLRWKHPSPPFNESRIEIHDMNGAVLATKDFKSADGEHGRNVQKAEWSPNSQFFVFSTASSGGHSPWHWQTYFYDRKRKTAPKCSNNKFSDPSDTFSPVGWGNFILKSPLLTLNYS
jgi:hypothetical protein